MTQRNQTPTGSSFGENGQVDSVVNDVTNFLGGIQKSVSDTLSGIFGGGDESIPNTENGDVPTTAGDRLIGNEARVDQAERTQGPLASLPFTSADGNAIQNLRNSRHAVVLEENKFAVRLRSIQNRADLVVFRVSPDISEARTAGYKTLEPIHMPGAIQVYQNTAPRTWNLSGIKLVSRNGEEAEDNLATVNQLRSWMMPFFGKTNTEGVGEYPADLLGSPPDVLEFTAYSNTASENNPSAGTITNIRKIPTIMTTMNINYPTDVDYIETSITSQPFPAVMTVDIILVETHSPTQLSNFDLIAYRNGQLEGF